MSTLVLRLSAVLLALVSVLAVQASPVDAAGRVRPYHVNGRFGLDTNLRTTSGWSAWAIDEWLARETPLRGLGSAFMQAERRYDVNARYLVAHAMHESDSGTSFIARSKHNLFGYNAYDRDPSGAATASTARPGGSPLWPSSSPAPTSPRPVAGGPAPRPCAGCTTTRPIRTGARPSSIGPTRCRSTR